MLNGIIHEAPNKPFSLGQKAVWTLGQLPPLQPMDGFAFKADPGL